jgi:tripartite-type tricarboxylate transporter receptor subunit TctC
MNRLVRSLAGATAASAVGLVLLGSALAADWPSRPVRIVVQFAAGGAADTLGRIFGAQLTAAFGQQFYIENRVGGGGVLAAETVIRAAPDGYTLLVSGLPLLVLLPPMNKNADFDPIRDFTHIAYFGGPPIVLVAHKSLGVRNFQEFAALARGSKQSVQYVSPGLGSTGDVVGEYLSAKADLHLQHLPYKGGGEAIMDLIAGHVQVGSLTWSTAVEHIRSGTLVALGVTSAARIPGFPDVPTFRELGFPDLVLTSWFSLSGPANMPHDIVAKLNHAVNASMDQPEVQKHLQQEAIETRSMTPEEFTEFVRSEVAKWAPVVKTAVEAK